MWELALTLLLGSAFLGVGLVFRNKRLQSWQEAAVSSGLHIQEVSGWTHRLAADPERPPRPAREAPAGRRS